MKKLLTAIFLSTVLFSFGQTGKRNCVCAESQITSKTEPDTIFYLQNGTPISLCGYKFKDSNPTTYTKFILAFCLPDTLLDIDIWTSSQFCTIKIVGDTLLVDETETKTTDKFYLKGLEVIRKTSVNTSNCQLANPDTSVFGIVLLDENSSLKKIGVMPTPLEHKNDLPHLNFCTQYNKQTLTLFFHPGSVINEFAEFEVRSYSSSDNAKLLMTNSFTTGNGIKLGLSKENVVAILGNCYQTSSAKKNLEIIKYHINDLNNSEFLQRFNYPSYYAEYEFKAGRLVRFRFGFEYP